MIKGLSIPLKHLTNRLSTNYNETSSELINKIMNKKDYNWKIDVKTKLNTTSLYWNRVNMTDLQFFNYLKENTRLVNDYDFLPMFYLKEDYINNESHKTLILENYFGITSKDVKYEVKLKDVTFSSDIYNIVSKTNRTDYLHITKPNFKSIGGKSRKEYNSFKESILSEFINSPNVLANSGANIKLKNLYKNSSDLSFHKVVDGYYLNMIELGNVFSMSSYINDGVPDVSYFNIIGYEFDFKGEEAGSVIKSNIIVSPLIKIENT